MPSRCRMPSEYALTGRRPTPASPTCSSAWSMRARRVRRDPPGPAASMIDRLARAPRCPYAAGASTSAPTRCSTDRACLGIRAPSTSTVPAVGSTSPSSIRTVVVLPEPFGPRKP